MWNILEEILLLSVLPSSELLERRGIEADCDQSGEAPLFSEPQTCGGGGTASAYASVMSYIKDVEGQGVGCSGIPHKHCTKKLNGQTVG